MRIEILRRKKGEKDSYLQVFEYEKPLMMKLY